MQNESISSPSHLPAAQAVAGGTHTAFVDFLGITFKAKDPSALRPWLEHLLRLWFGDVSLTETGKGWSGYAVRLDIEGVGLAAYGGNSDTLHVEITGQGCAQVKDWADVADTIDDFEGKITRIDLAADDFEGRAWSIEWARAQYESDGFKPQRGCSPNAQLWSDEGSGKGSTYYVGSRESGKLYRGYEKGKQQGDPNSRWFRNEVEFRAIKRELTADMIRHPGHYLAGAYPCLAEISIEQSVCKTVAYINAATIEKCIDHAKKQAGRIVHALLALTRGDISGVLARIYRPEVPKRLKGVVQTMLAIDEAEQANTTARMPDFMRETKQSEVLALFKAFTLETASWRNHFAPEPPAHAIAA